MDHCPGLYCGRTLLESGNWSDCDACPRGFRTNSSHCIPCSDNPEFYDWLYLLFVVLCTLVLHWICIDVIRSKERLSICQEGLFFSSLLETIIASVATLLIVEPIGVFEVRSCKALHLSDWYTLLFNPTPNYEETLHCTQEAVYPLYSMVFIFYSIAALTMLLVRPCFIGKYARGKLSIYAALYFFPILALCQAVLGGIIYYTFPYIVIIASLISSATHFAYKVDQSMVSLVVSTFTDLRNFVILVGHWLFHAYGIIAVTELKDPVFHWFMMALVPLPTIFYIITAKFTDPSKLHVE